jgi:uncharacterized metal-binding protein YceD (DUF177 family)
MKPELHRPLRADEVGPQGASLLVEANGAECKAVAERLGVPEIHSLTCRFELANGPGGRIDATGDLRARLTRVCVVSLDPFETELAERFRVDFVEEGTEADEDPESVDEIPMPGGVLDLGEAVVEQLALALDPYPRKPGAELPETGTAPAETPFAALSALKRRQ